MRDAIRQRSSSRWRVTMIRTRSLSLTFLLSGLSLAALQAGVGPMFLCSCLSSGTRFTVSGGLGPAHIDVNLTTPPPPPPGKVKYDISPNPDEGLNPGDCVEITGLDSSGHSTGFKTVVAVPATVIAPEVNTGAVTKKVPCPQTETSGIHGTTPFHVGHLNDVVSRVWGFPTTAGNSTGPFDNAWYDFKVLASGGAEPESQVIPILSGGPGTAVPSNVQLLSLTQVRETNGGW